MSRNPTTLTVRQLRAKKFPPGEFIIGSGLLNRGAIFMIGGPPKSYKSIITNSILCSLATGQPLFNATRAVRDSEREPVFPIDRAYHVLYVEMEVGEQDLQHRFEQYLTRLDPAAQNLISDYVHVHSGDHDLRFDDPAGFDMLRTIIGDSKAEVVCFDPLIEFHGADENSSNEMAKILRQIDKLRVEFGFATIIDHHTSKPSDNGRHGGDTLRGSSVLYGKIDSLMTLAPDPKQIGLVKVEFKVRRGPNIESCYLQVDDETLRTHFVAWSSDPKLKDKRGRAKKPDGKVLPMAAASL